MNENIASWSNFLEVVSSNPFELAPRDLHKVQATATATLQAAVDSRLDYELLNGVLASMDAL